MPLREYVPLEGELNCWSRDFDVPDILLAVCATGRTGLLRFASAEAEKTLFIKQGCIIFATSSSSDDRLGEYLLRIGTLSLQDLANCSTKVVPGKRLGGILVEEGLLDPQGLVRAVVGQVRSIILSLFRWAEAWYGFSEQELPSKETITLKMPTAQLIIEGVRMVDSWRRIGRGLGAMDAVFRSVAGYESELRSLEIDTSSLEILAALGHPKSIEEICSDFPLADIEICHRLWAFRCLGWIERVEPETKRPDSRVQPREVQAAGSPAGRVDAAAESIVAAESPGEETSAASLSSDPPGQEEVAVIEALDPGAEDVGSVEPLDEAEILTETEAAPEAEPHAEGAGSLETDGFVELSFSQDEGFFHQEESSADSFPGTEEFPPSSPASEASEVKLEEALVDSDLEGLGMILGDSSSD